jgi:hypothetical protein
MSLQLIQQYCSAVEKFIQYGGSKNETAIRSAFQTLLQKYSSDRNLILVPQLDYETKYGTSVKPDGMLKDTLRQDWGYWKSKDSYDNLDDEIEYKINKGYPTSNSIFEDGQTAVLIQNSKEASRTEIKNPIALHNLYSRLSSTSGVGLTAIGD